MNELGRNHFIKRWWRIIDQQIIIALAILFSFSLMLVTTASPAVASRIGLTENYFSSRHFLYLLVATLLILFFSFFDRKWIKRFAIVGFLGSLAMLIMVKFNGYEVKGAKRWISIYGFSCQPSEFIKPFLAVVIGWILSLRYQEEFPSFRISMFLYILIIFPLIMQPDFGMVVLLTAVTMVQFFAAGMPIIWFIVAIFSGIIGIITSYFFMSHVANRINSYLDPTSSENYQVNKSILAFEHGGMYGRGPGEGAIKQTLPDSHADFIFAVAGEEFGAIICLMIISVFAFIVLRSLFRLLKEDDKFVQFAAIGLITQFGLQAIINISVTLNLLPTKGMTLPFISYGGSSMFASSIAIGMLIGLTKRETSLIKYRIKNIDI